MEGENDTTALANVLAGNSVPLWHDAYVKPWTQYIGSGYPGEAWSWTKTYLTLANALCDLLFYAPLALRARGATAPTAVVEWPTRAAVRIGGRTFAGDSHFDAIAQAQALLGENALARGTDVATDGFLTNAGRYVSREEAGRMLDAVNQTRHYKTWLGNEKKGKAGLLSEALELYDPRTGRER
jgi:hypothetical protein